MDMWVLFSQQTQNYAVPFFNSSVITVSDISAAANLTQKCFHWSRFLLESRLTF